MKRILALLALLFLTELAYASALVTTAVGSTQVATGPAPARPLRTGDRVNQGDTVITGAQSSLVLKFDDGQVTALTANSRMTVTNFSYTPASGGGSMLLSLISGGMRAITGLIGKTNPNRVTVRAGAATIGIRGTDFTIVVDGAQVFVQVTGGLISFTFNNQTVTVDTGRAAVTRPDGTVSQGTINQISTQLQGTAAGQAILDTVGGIQGLSSEINKAFPGTPPGQSPPPPPPPPPNPGNPPGGPPGGGSSSPS